MGRAEPSPGPGMREGLFAGIPLGPAVLARVRRALAAYEPLDVRTSRSQIAFRRRHGFAYLWPPGRYLARPRAEVVLSIALGRRDPSPRFKEVTRVSPRHWMHHLEVRSASDIDDVVEGWLREAAERAG